MDIAPDRQPRLGPAAAASRPAAGTRGTAGRLAAQ